MGKGRHAIRVEDLPEYYREQARAQLAATPAVRTDTEPEPDEGAALGRQGGDPLVLVDPARPLLVRIVRVGGRRMDDDNLAGGCKELRDAIASALGRRGDSEADGLFWEYDQEAGDEAVRVEINERT